MILSLWRKFTNSIQDAMPDGDPPFWPDARGLRRTLKHVYLLQLKNGRDEYPDEELLNWAVPAYQNAKRDWDADEARDNQPDRTTAQDLFVSAFALYSFGNLDAVIDVIDTKPYVDYYISPIFPFTSQLLPLCDETLSNDRRIKQYREVNPETWRQDATYRYRHLRGWVLKYRDNLVWDAQTLRYVFRPSK